MKGRLLAVLLISSSAYAATAATVKPVKPGQNWQWQLDGTVDETILDGYTGPKLIDIDMEGADAALVARLKAKGIYTVAYLETGAWESYRSDADQFPAAALGNPLNGYPDEQFLDIRPGQPYSATVLSLIKARILAAANKGFDGIEPDLDDTGANFSGCAGEDGDTGFCITLAQNIAFNAQLAAYAHSLGLSWGQKNGGGDAAFTAAEINMVHADWALIEECNRYGGCPTYTTYINLGKAVLNAEYKQDRMTTAKFCPADNMRNFDGILKSNALGATPRTACRAVN
jgi:hypothetical protein